MGDKKPCGQDLEEKAAVLSSPERLGENCENEGILEWSRKGYYEILEARRRGKDSGYRQINGEQKDDRKKAGGETMSNTKLNGGRSPWGSGGGSFPHHEKDVLRKGGSYGGRGGLAFWSRGGLKIVVPESTRGKCPTTSHDRQSVEKEEGRQKGRGYIWERGGTTF